MVADRAKRNHRGRPSNVFCLAIASKDVVQSETGNLTDEFLTAALVRLTFQGETAIPGTIQIIRSVPAIWQQLEKLSSSHCRNVVCTVDLRRIAPLVNVFALVDCGRITLQKPREVDKSKKKRGGKKLKSSALFLLQPNISCFSTWLRSGEKLQWIDLCNYYGREAHTLGTVPCRSLNVGLSESATLEEMDQACKDECSRLMGLAERVLNRPDADLSKGFTLSISTSAVQSAREFNRNPIVLAHGNRAARRLERAAYFGGLTTPLWTGPVLGSGRIKDGRILRRKSRCPIVASGSIVSLDQIAQYGDIQIQEPLPFRILYFGRNPSMDELETHGLHGCAIAHVYLETSEPFPFRGPYGQFVWACGRYWTTLAGPELRQALEWGVVRGVTEIAVYELTKDSSSWTRAKLERRQNMRADGDQAGAHLIKREVNALHGKLSCLSREWQDAPDVFAAAPWSEWFESSREAVRPVAYRSVGWSVQRDTITDNPNVGLVAFGAFVTAHGRMRVRGLLDLIGKQSVYYLSADSVHTDSHGLSLVANAGLLSELEIGKWKAESETDLAIYYGVNQYRWGSELVLAGLPMTARILDRDAWTYEMRRSPFAARPIDQAVTSERQIHEWTQPWQSQKCKDNWCSWHDADLVIQEYDEKVT